MYMTSRLFNYFLMCWINRTVDDAKLTNAVNKGYITEKEKSDIEAVPQNPIE